MKTSCPICNSRHLIQFYEQNEVPVFCNLLYASRDEAKNAPRADIHLVYCRECSHVFNRSFDPDRMVYRQEYENSLHYSPRFQQYAEQLAADLIEKYRLRDKTIIEIGCGRGDFLRMICKAGGNRGIGFDPSDAAGKSFETNGVDVEIIHDYYSSGFTGATGDFIYSRHTIEHLDDPRGIMTDIRKNMDIERTVFLFVEVPNGMATLKDFAIWDIIYEHYSYFTPTSLQKLLAISGFQLLDVYPAFGGQFLCAEASNQLVRGRHGHAIKPGSENVATLCEQFTSRHREKCQALAEKLRNAGRNEPKLAVWGAGSKGVTFVQHFANSHSIECVIDINPNKHGRYVAGSGLPIVAPEYLNSHPVDFIIVMNPLYGPEIRRSISEMQLNAELIYA